MDEHVYSPVEAQSTYEETLNRLGNAIRLGVLRPGQRLPPERELAERLQISRSTLRQALGVLTESGHLIAVRGRSGGTFVAESPPLSVTDGDELGTRYEELMAYRTAVEVGAAAMAAERAGATELDGLDVALERQRAVAPDDAVGYMRADAAFHLALARAVRNARIERLMTELQGESMELIAVQIRSSGLPATLVGDSLGQHTEIAAAVRAGDPGRAAARVREHMRLFGAAIAGPR